MDDYYDTRRKVRMLQDEYAKRHEEFAASETFDRGWAYVMEPLHESTRIWDEWVKHWEHQGGIVQTRYAKGGGKPMS